MGQNVGLLAAAVSGRKGCAGDAGLGVDERCCGAANTSVPVKKSLFADMGWRGVVGLPQARGAAVRCSTASQGACGLPELPRYIVATLEIQFLRGIESL